jgi:hypothetical protein
VGFLPFARRSPVPRDRRLDPYRDRIAELRDDGVATGYVLFTVGPADVERQRWWSPRGTGGHEVLEWYVDFLPGSGWYREEGFSDPVDHAVELLDAGRWEVGDDVLVVMDLEWLDGDAAERLRREHFPPRRDP